ncbi:hypothetical protein LTR08_007468 [Meristemomyces frigidus]|nr:hypothetical protein LTR08_007468 [Meristemomyces frigidus]
MSDDEADPELLELLRQTLLGPPAQRTDEVSRNTGVLRDAEYIYNNSIDVSVDMYGTKAAAASIYASMQERHYSTDAWSEHELHPKSQDGFSELAIVNFIFTMDLLNFSFWSELSEAQRYQVEYRGKRWTGYNSLVACLRRALDEGVPITTPRYWRSEDASYEVLRRVFRSATDEQIPLLDERVAILKDVAEVLHKSFGDPVEDNFGANDEQVAMIIDGKANGILVPEEAAPDAVGGGQQTVADVKNIALPPDDEPEQTTGVAPDQEEGRPSQDADTQPSIAPEAEPPLPQLQPDYSIARLIEQADRSAGKLVNLLAKHFPAFCDETRFDGKRVRLLKRAQILVADLWAAFGGTGNGEFNDINHLTMFADYRVPQMLRSIGVISYSPPLDYRISTLQPIFSGQSFEVQLRGCSIWAVELIRREILRAHPDAQQVNAVLIDFFLYDLAKEKEKVQGGLATPHHRTRSIWY